MTISRRLEHTPQIRIPDERVSHRMDCTNQQMAIRALTDVVAQLVMHGTTPGTARRSLLEKLGDVLLWNDGEKPLE